MLEFLLLFGFAQWMLLKNMLSCEYKSCISLPRNIYKAEEMETTALEYSGCWECYLSNKRATFLQNMSGDIQSLMKWTRRQIKVQNHNTGGMGYAMQEAWGGGMGYAIQEAWGMQYRRHGEEARGM